jgi:ubiquinone/menaquinone biosynthesis C-methylase UbiE
VTQNGAAEVSELDEAAARAFSAQAAVYDRTEPSYPVDAITWLIEKLGIKPGRQIVDLAAGTGTLTEMLTGVGADIVVIEPVASLRCQLRARLPDIPVLAGLAEALPLADKSVDAVVVARAFHWFHTRRAMGEMARVVRPGGGLGLIWNARDRSAEWVDQVWSVMDRAGRPASRRDPDSSWSPWIEATFNHVRDRLPVRVDAVYTERLG